MKQSIAMIIAMSVQYNGDHSQIESNLPPGVFRDIAIPPPKPVPERLNGGHIGYVLDVKDISGRNFYRVTVTRFSEATGTFINGNLHLKKYGTVAYPPLKNGQIVPMFGALYRVESAAFICELKLIESKDLPPGISFQYDSFFIPIRHPEFGGETREKGLNRLHCEKIVADKDQKQTPVAELRIDISEPTRSAGNAQVREGDILVLGEFGHRVRKVVPADTKTKVIGWVEFDTKGIPVDELKKSKDRIVRPAN